MLLNFAQAALGKETGYMHWFMRSAGYVMVGAVMTIAVSWALAHAYPWVLMKAGADRVWLLADEDADGAALAWVQPVTEEVGRTHTEVRAYAPLIYRPQDGMGGRITPTSFQLRTRWRWWSGLLEPHLSPDGLGDGDGIPRYGRTSPVPVFAATAWGWPMRAMCFSSGGRNVWMVGKPYPMPPGPDARCMIPLRPIPLGFTINTLLAAAALWLLRQAKLALFRWNRRRRGQCAECGYDISENQGACSECGAAI